MKLRRLGKTGREVSEIGLGCWQLGGDFGPIEEDRARGVLKAASEAGITFFDTADVYGAGKSEERVGAYVNDHADYTMVATKVGRTPELYPDNYTEDGIRTHLKMSAARLGVSQLDLVQLHCVPPAVLKDGKIFDIMEKMKKEELVEAWGASVETLDEAEICLDHDGCSTLQIIFNIFRQDAAWSLLDKAKERDVGVIVRLPLASGLLTGKFGADTHFDATDHRNYNREGAAFSVGETFSGISFPLGVEMVHDLEEMKPEGMSMVHFALRWILDHDGVSTVIAGASKPEQATQNAAASDLPPLPEELHERLDDFYRERVREQIKVPI